MKKTDFKGYVLLLAVMMLLLLAASCSKKGGEAVSSATLKQAEAPAAADASPETEGPSMAEEVAGIVMESAHEGEYTYHDAVSQMPTNWNPHTYQTSSDSAPSEFIRAGFYRFIFNDDIHPLEGQEPFTGYVIMPEMAESFPVDVTEEVRKSHPEFNIPVSAEKGYAYTIDLNKDARWENGKAIDASTYVESMKRLLDPSLLNYRAADIYRQNLSIAGAEAYSRQGQKEVMSLRDAMVREGAEDAESFMKAHAEVKGFINWARSFGSVMDITSGNPVEGTEAKDEVTDSGVSLADLAAFFMKTAEGEGEKALLERLPDELYIEWTYPEGIEFSSVGLYESGEHQITIVLSKALSGFQLLYSLTSTWLVEPGLYDSCLRETAGVWTSNYNTSVETTLSYGPYRLVSYQADKAMRYEKNPEWYGWSDGKHVFSDPDTGETVPMYMTTAVDVQKVSEASTMKLMFLSGELMTYGLQAEDFSQYRNSEYVHVIPDETIFFLILNGHGEAIRRREASGEFSRDTTDLETMLVPAFRKAVALTYDKELFAATISPQRSGAYGIIGTSYIHEPETGARYRDTDQAKKVLCDFYSVDPASFPSLDDAVSSITGFDPVRARELYTEAFEEALSKGYITDKDGDGKSDQTVTIEYCLSSDNSFMTKTVDYLNGKMNEVTAGTPFENRVKFVKSAPYGNEWTNRIKSGLSDTVLGGWSGSLLNPFGLTELYTDPGKQYDAAWFDSSSVDMTLEVPSGDDTVELTMSLRKWSEALNGETVKAEGREWNFGEGQADPETRLNILAGIEGEVLRTYDYLPLLQNAGMVLLSQKAYYVTDEYNPIMGRGGITYLRYDYDDAAWAEYVRSQGGKLRY